MRTLWSVNAGFNSTHPWVTLKGSKVDPTEAWEMEDNVRTSRHAFSKCRRGLGREGLSKDNVARTRPYGVIRSLVNTGFYPLGKMVSIERPARARRSRPSGGLERRRVPNTEVPENVCVS